MPTTRRRSRPVASRSTAAGVRRGRDISGLLGSATCRTGRPSILALRRAGFLFLPRRPRAETGYSIARARAIRGCRDAESEEDVSCRSCRCGLASSRRVVRVCSRRRIAFARCLPTGTPPMCHSANAAATPRSPSAASAGTPPLALVARSLAMERPPLGLGPRELEMVASERTPTVSTGNIF